VNSVLAAWNGADETPARGAMLACCGATRWAAEMTALRPMASVEELSETADRVWAEMGEADWLEAFACHPRIGERKATQAGGQIPQGSGQSAAWSKQEQAGTSGARGDVMVQMEEGNKKYEEKFGFTYIVCATGKSAEEMLAILKRRLDATREEELREAAVQQRQIMQIRLRKWLTE
jgi:OHCU decarboxylase